MIYFTQVLCVIVELVETTGQPTGLTGQHKAAYTGWRGTMKHQGAQEAQASTEEQKVTEGQEEQPGAGAAAATAAG